MLLFLDVDGVLLGKTNKNDVRHCLAASCEEFIDFSLEHFDCYWLTTHCKGDAETVLDYLRPYASPQLLEKLMEIKPTTYKTFKTEALFGDFIWIDDSPTMYEINYLEQSNLLNRWLQVNTRKDYHALEKLMPDISAITQQIKSTYK